MKNQKYLAEFLGTFFLVLFGTGAIIINDLFSNNITHIGIAVSFGLVIMVMIYTFGAISGAHFNPAVSVGFFIRKTIQFRELVLYSASQLAGGLAASLILRLALGAHPTLGGTSPSIPVLLAFIVEVIITFFHCFVIMRLALGVTNSHSMDGLVIGSTVFLAALVAGPLTGASMNPVRSLAPSIVSGQIDYIWIYLTAPIIGSFCASILSKQIDSILDKYRVSQK